MVVVGAVLLAGLGAAGRASAVPPESVPPESVPPESVPADSVPVDSVPVDPASPEGEGESGEVVGGEGEAPPVTLPLIPVPTGCHTPPAPHVVFVGAVVDRDYRSIRYEIEQVRAGRPDPFAAGGRIDVRYGLDAQYLDDGETYLVSAVVDPDLGILTSRVTEPIEQFGGDEVIGVSESDINCPVLDDTHRTLHLDGTAIDAGVLDPLFGSRGKLLGAVLTPFAVAFAVVFLLAMFRLSVAGLFRTVTHRR